MTLKPIYSLCHSALFLLVIVCANLASAHAFPDPVLYLKGSEMPNMIHWLPAPPQEGSARFEYDKAQYEWGKSMRADSARAAMAVSQAEYSIAMLCREFSAAFGHEISAEATPEIYRLLINGTQTCRQCTKRPKNHYRRTRPYVYFGEGTLIPSSEAGLKKNGSYPSGHTLLGVVAALLLTEVNPAAADALMQVAYEIGQSRVIAGYHWQSDVDASRMLAGAAYAALSSNSSFREQMRKAQAEFRALNE